MAAAGSAVKEGMWIARMWRKGWQTMPVIMVSHCLSTPCIIYFYGRVLLFGKPTVLAEKYRNEYTVVRPGDPRIETINNYSPIDKVGFF